MVIYEGIKKVPIFEKGTWELQKDKITAGTPPTCVFWAFQPFLILDVFQY